MFFVLRDNARLLGQDNKHTQFYAVGLWVGFGLFRPGIVSKREIY